jgi:5-methylcytosine-specific restriction endonuclease McrA
MTVEEARSALTSTTWHPETLDLAIRAGFRCEYCGRNFFNSVDDYYSFQRDHIVPRGMGGEKFDNLAAVCDTCNFLKRRWDPRTEVGESASREELIEAARRHIRGKRREKAALVETERQLASLLIVDLGTPKT